MDNQNSIGRIEKVLSQLKKNVECCICLDMLNNPVSTKCGHQYCKFCITKFLKTKPSLPCPLCKKPVSKRSLIERPYLSNAVSHLKELISAFQMDTGILFSPRKEPENLSPSTPESIRATKSKRRKLELEPAVNKKNVNGKRISKRSVDENAENCNNENEKRTNEQPNAISSRLKRAFKEPQVEVKEIHTADDFLCDIEAENLAFEQNVKNMAMCDRMVQSTGEKEVLVAEKDSIVGKKKKNRPKRQRKGACQVTNSVNETIRRVTRNNNLTSSVEESPAFATEETLSPHETDMTLPRDCAQKIDELMVAEEKHQITDKQQSPTVNSPEKRTVSPNDDATSEVKLNSAENNVTLKDTEAPRRQQFEVGIEVTDKSTNKNGVDKAAPNDEIDDSGHSVVHMAAVTQTYSRKRKRGKKENCVKVSAWLQTLTKNEELKSTENRHENSLGGEATRNCIYPFQNGEVALKLDNEFCHQKVSNGIEEKEINRNVFIAENSEMNTENATVENEENKKHTGNGNEWNKRREKIISSPSEKSGFNAGGKSIIHMKTYSESKVENSQRNVENAENKKQTGNGNKVNKRRENILSSPSEKSGLNVGSKNMISMKRHGEIVCNPMERQEDCSRKVNQFKILQTDNGNDLDPYQFKSSQKTPKVQKKKKKGKSLKTRDKKPPLSILSVISKQTAVIRKKDLMSGNIIVISEDDRDVEQTDIPTENDNQVPKTVVGGKENNSNKKNKKCRFKDTSVDNNEEIARIAESISQAEDYDLLTCTQDVHNRMDMEMSPPQNKDISIAEHVQQNILLTSGKSPNASNDVTSLGVIPCPKTDQLVITPIWRRNISKTKHVKQENIGQIQVTEIPESVISEPSQNMIHSRVADKSEDFVDEEQFSETASIHHKSSDAPLKMRKPAFDFDETQYSCNNQDSIRCDKIRDSDKNRILASKEVCSHAGFNSYETLPSQSLDTQQSISLLLLQSEPINKQDHPFKGKEDERAENMDEDEKAGKIDEDEKAEKMDEDIQTNRDSDDDFVIKYSKRKCFSLGLTPEKSNHCETQNNSEICSEKPLTAVASDKDELRTSLEFTKNIHFDDSDVEFPDGCIEVESNACSYSERNAKVKSAQESCEFIPPTDENITKKSSATHTQTSSKDYISVTDGASVDTTPIISVVPKRKKPLFRDTSDAPDQEYLRQTQNDTFSPEIVTEIEISRISVDLPSVDTRNSENSKSLCNEQELTGKPTQQDRDVSQDLGEDNFGSKSLSQTQNGSLITKEVEIKHSEISNSSKPKRRKCRTVRGLASRKSPRVLCQKQELEENQELIKTADVTNANTGGKELQYDDENMEDETPSDIFMMDSHMPISGRASTCQTQVSDDLVRVHDTELGIDSDEDKTQKVNQCGRTFKKELSEVKNLSQNRFNISDTCSEYKNKNSPPKFKADKEMFRKKRSAANDLVARNCSDLNSLKNIGMKGISAIGTGEVRNERTKKSPKFAYGSPGKQWDSPKRKLSHKIKNGSGSLSNSFEFTQVSDNLKKRLEQGATFNASGKQLKRDRQVLDISNNSETVDVHNPTVRSSGITTVPDSVLISSNNCTQVTSSSVVQATAREKHNGMDTRKFRQVQDACDDDDMLEIVRNVLGKNDDQISDGIEDMADELEKSDSQHRFDASSPVVGDERTLVVDLHESEIEELDFDEHDDICSRETTKKIENDDLDTDDEFIGRKRRRNCPIEEDESDEASTQESSISCHLNMTSSSAFSSQSEVITTQKKNELKDGIKKIQERLTLLTRMQNDYQSKQSLSENGNVVNQQDTGEQTPVRQSEDGECDQNSDTDDETQSSNPIEKSVHDMQNNSHTIEETEKIQLFPGREDDNANTIDMVKDSVVSSDGDSDDLFLSPLSPTPPSSLADEQETKMTDLPEDVQKALEMLNRAMGSVEVHKQSKIQKQIQKALNSPTTPKISSKKRKQVSTFPQKPMVQGKVSKNNPNPRVLIASGLSSPQLRDVQKLARQNGCEFHTAFDVSVTHVVIKTESEDSLLCDRTLKFFQGVANKCWILSFQWIADSKIAGHLLPEDEYEILGDTVNGADYRGPHKSRCSSRNLFENFEFYCLGESEELVIESLHWLVKTCGGTVETDLTRFGLDEERQSLIVTCSNMEDDEQEDTLEYNRLYQRYGFVTVSREWVLDSLTMYSLQPLDDYVLTCCKNMNIPKLQGQ